jgi:hypothetical protein
MAAPHGLPLFFQTAVAGAALVPVAAAFARYACTGAADRPSGSAGPPSRRPPWRAPDRLWRACSAGRASLRRPRPEHQGHAAGRNEPECRAHGCDQTWPQTCARFPPARTRLAYRIRSRQASLACLMPESARVPSLPTSSPGYRHRACGGQSFRIGCGIDVAVMPNAVLPARSLPILQRQRLVLAATAPARPRVPAPGNTSRVAVAATRFSWARQIVIGRRLP